MNIKSLFTDDDAVSPVIGVILMVAITVILAAVIGAFVLDLGGSTQATPSGSFNFDEADHDNDGTVDDVKITYESGDAIDPTQLSTNPSGLSFDGGDWSSKYSGADSISAGDSVTVTGLSSDTTLRITWESEDGSTSSTLSTYDYEA